MDHGEDYFHEITRLENIQLIARNFHFSPSDVHIPLLEVYDYSIQIEDFPIVEKSLFIKDIHIELHSEEGASLAELKVRFTFEIADLPKFISISNESGKQILESGMDTWLNNIILATTRGLIYSEFRGSSIHAAIFPLVNPHHLKES